MKTLKDLRWHSSDTSQFTEEDLREEAIKWIKEMDKSLESNNIPNSLIKIQDNVKIGLIATRQWIMMFFNLTEEDLNKE